VSQANARQRSGRAGRVQPGVCYRLISSVGFNKVCRSDNIFVYVLPVHTCVFVMRSQ
jgi:hypothetical protein